MCQAWYHACDGNSSSITTGNYVPHEATSSPQCVALNPALPTFSHCDEATQPSPEYCCVASVWTYPRTLSQAIVANVPIVIVGNLTAPSVTISNPSASITVQGCVETTTVEITLTPAQIEVLQKTPSAPRTILTQLGSHCPNSLASVTVSSSTSGKTCKKLKATKDDVNSNASNLAIALRVDVGGCRVWWIVLASVLGGVVIIATIIPILYFTYKPFRRLVSPFRRRNVKSL